MANVQHDLAATRMGLLDHLDPGELDADLARLQQEAATSLVTDGYAENDHVFLHSVDLRYLGQEHSVTLQLPGPFGTAGTDDLREAFAEAHEQAYGHTMPDPVEMVAIRVTGTKSLSGS